MRNTELLNEYAEEKIDKLPAVFRYIIHVLLDCIDNIINGKCDEEELVSTMSTLNNNANGRYCKDDLLNYDKAGEILGFGSTNRVGLKRLLDKNNIKEVVINNMKVGFRRSEVMALRNRLNDEIRKRELKRREITRKFNCNGKDTQTIHIR